MGYTSWYFVVFLLKKKDQNTILWNLRALSLQTTLYKKKMTALVKLCLNTEQVAVKQGSLWVLYLVIHDT